MLSKISLSSFYIGQLDTQLKGENLKNETNYRTNKWKSVKKALKADIQKLMEQLFGYVKRIFSTFSMGFSLGPKCCCNECNGLGYCMHNLHYDPRLI